MKANKKKSQIKEVLKRLAKNRLGMVGLIVIIIMVCLALLAPVIAPYDYAAQDYMATFLKPGSEGHLLGTDSLGRDILSRVLYGARYSLGMGFLAVILAAVIGDTLGALAGYYGGKVDAVIMRALDIFQAIPPLILCIALAAVLGAGLGNAVVAIGITTAPWHARMIRGSIMQVRGMEYVEAAKAINASDKRIILKHIIPNAMAPSIVQITMDLGGAIMMAATLSFIGLGAQAPTPEWGMMLSESRGFIRDSGYLVLVPGIMIMITVLAFNLFGDGLRDALDPKLKEGAR